MSQQNFKRVVLMTSSKEFKTVLNQFEITMKNKYSTIVKIERIQNERWYKQVFLNLSTAEDVDSDLRIRHDPAREMREIHGILQSDSST